jgi:hypothetical protein
MDGVTYVASSIYLFRENEYLSVLFCFSWKHGISCPNGEIFPDLRQVYRGLYSVKKAKKMLRSVKCGMTG